MQLTVTTKGQITLRKSVLKHINVHPGEKVELDLNENGHATLKAIKPTHTWNEVANYLDGQAVKTSLTLEQIEQAIIDGYTSHGSRGR